MADDGAILIGKSGKPENLLLKLANRHGLVTGATGTGKTVTLQVMAEGFARSGVPVFAADIKGDLSGIVAPGDSKPAFVSRAKEIGVKYEPDQFTTVFWDVFGEQGHPVRATISEMGPLLLARLLDLNDTAEGVLNIAFRIADEQKLLLLDLKDLRAILTFIAENASDLTTKYGNVSPATVGTIQRGLLVLENQKGDLFFGEPALDINDLMKTDRDGRGVINILAADKLMNNPRLYATFLLWLLSELFEQLPEVGDLDKPKLVFFFDEAHLLFNGAPKALLTAVEQVVRLIRSKGVGVYFVTQNPLDVPDTVLAQLGNRVQHALRAFTPRDQKAVRAAAETFRQNPKIDTEQAITQLAVGEALISMLEGKGSPEMVERALIAPPMAQVGPCTPQQRQQAINSSPVKGKYDTMVDRESAYEVLMQRKNLNPDGSPIEASTDGGGGGGILDTIGGWLGGGAPQQRPKTGPGSRGGPLPQSMTEKIITSAARSAATSIGRQVGTAILRGILGSMTGKR
ncbi:helicase HerA-like domain-containing protein [Bosea sp. RCC_152_1]|uniref:helicase HerA-like domain-containing protein n=1 Tax=Bosea sp. RCC_152_1 TaxID=3239228 RepID=UPI001150BF8F